MGILEFKEASKKDRYLRAVLDGISGGGKTMTALMLACNLAEKIGGEVCVADTEGGSSEDYADLFKFRVARLRPPYTPERYIDAMREMQKAGFAIAVVDSFSHLWAGEGGELEEVDRLEERDKFSKGWRSVTPKHNKVLSEILNIEMGLIGTLRAKSEYVIEKVDRGGRMINVPRKIGMKPVMRDMFEYEFQLAGTMSSASLTITKSRMHGVFTEGDVIDKPGKEFAEKVWGWLHHGSGSYAPVLEKQDEDEPTATGLGGADFTPEEKDRIRKVGIRNLAQFEHWVSQFANREQALAELVKMEGE